MSFFHKEDKRGLAWEYVEVSDKPLPIVEDDESVRSLLNHPGFVILNNRLRIQKALLETELRRGSHKEIRDVEKLQSGIFWLEYLQSEVDRAVGRKREPVVVTPTLSERELFDQVYSQIKGV